jgi:DNA modification methylase
MQNIGLNGEKIKPDKSWSFSNKATYNTTYLTHNYYSYPAKFIPQIASRLIKENSKVGDIVIDPFMGSGTTIVEALINNRIGIGCDINYIAYLVSKTKTTPINSSVLENELLKINFDLESRLNGQFDFYLSKSKEFMSDHVRIDYWFKENQKNRLAIIYARIQEVKNIPVKNLFLVAFAQILKTCSVWLQSSVKPQRDPIKVDYDPLVMFVTRVKIMAKGNKELIEKLDQKTIKEVSKYRSIYKCDARKIPCQSNLASLIVTSPPYVTSYEYADLHQLPTIWFKKMSDINLFRQKFIGSEFKLENTAIDLHSNTAELIINNLISRRKAKEIRKYYSEMFDCFKEMKRVLRKDGMVCLVIGDTNYKNTEIANHSVFIEQIKSIGFKIENLILREVTSKMLPTFRDPISGKFAKTTAKKVKLVHPKEYIIIAKK